MTLEEVHIIICEYDAQDARAHMICTGSHRGAVGPLPRHLVREEMLERLLVVVGLEAREEALEEGVGERDAVGVGDDRHGLGGCC